MVVVAAMGGALASVGRRHGVHSRVAELRRKRGDQRPRAKPGAEARLHGGPRCLRPHPRGIATAAIATTASVAVDFISVGRI